MILLEIIAVGRTQRLTEVAVKTAALWLLILMLTALAAHTARESWVSRRFVIPPVPGLAWMLAAIFFPIAVLCAFCTIPDGLLAVSLVYGTILDMFLLVGLIPRRSLGL